MQLHTFDSSRALNQQFAEEICNRLAKAIAEKGSATLVVSGGKTPLPLFKTLSEADLDWSRVTITLADDRWLPPNHADSNEGLVKAHLLQGKAAKARFISLFDPESPDDAYQGAATVVERIATLPVFDVLILGMGEDGHTASLFPCSKEIQAGLAADAPVALAVTPSTAAYQRLSLSKNRLLHSAVIYLHLVGPNKLAVLEQAMAGQDPLQMPIRAFLQQQQVPVHVMFTAN